MEFPNGRRSLRRFKPGESCEVCHARRWYDDSGFRYCEQGHRIESFVSFDHEDPDNFGARGRTARKRKQTRTRETLHLTGQEGRELFLECLQVLLRKQVAWLQQRERNLLSPNQALDSDDVSHPSTALESVVRDLWRLRVRSFHDLTEATGSRQHRRHQRENSIVSASSRSPSRSRGASQVGASSVDVSDRESSVVRSTYSSNGESDGGYSTASNYPHRRQGKAPRKPRSRSARHWHSQVDAVWNVPTVLETLALCYLGGLLLRLPYRIGDFYRWAKNNQIPYLDATNHIPKKMLQRLPAGYQMALMTQTVSQSGGELHLAVMNLVRGYHINNGLRFPPLNVPAIVWLYIRELGLPVEVYAGVEELVRLSDEKFLYSVDRVRSLGLEHPDIFLLTAIVFTTKLLFPFSNNDNEGETDQQQAVRLDWHSWNAIFTEPDALQPAEHLQRKDMDKLRASDVWTMTGEQMDDYMNWHQETRLNERKDYYHLLRLFPLDLNKASQNISDAQKSEQVVEERYRRVQQTCIITTSNAPEEQEAPTSQDRPDSLNGHEFEIYATEDDLPATARVFYSKAAELGGVPVHLIVQAVSRLEYRWLAWTKLDAPKQAM